VLGVEQRSAGPIAAAALDLPEDWEPMGAVGSARRRPPPARALTATLLPSSSCADAIRAPSPPVPLSGKDRCPTGTPDPSNQAEAPFLRR